MTPINMKRKSRNESEGEEVAREKCLNLIRKLQHIVHSKKGMR